MSRDFVAYDQVTYDEMLRVWRERYDLTIAFFDADRIERALDYFDEPARVFSRPSPVQPVRPAMPAGTSGTAGARWGATTAHQHPDPDLPTAA